MQRLVVLLLLGAAVSFAQSGATVEGTVINSVTHAGVPGVSVTLWTQRGVRYNATTDTSGAFVVTGVQPGDYNSRFERTGLVQLQLPHFGQPRLRVGGSGSVRDDVQMDAKATLRGRVLDSEGKPAVKATVKVGRATATSDPDGRFEFLELFPGTYTIRADPPRQESLSAPKEGRAELVPTYYPSTTKLAEAERIAVRPGSELDGYEIHLRESPVFEVSGLVFDETGMPLPNVNVRLLRPAENRLLNGVATMGLQFVQYFVNLRGIGNQEASTISRADGTFEFSAVAPGEWSLRAEVDPQHDARQHIYQIASDTVPAMVSDHNLADVELRFAQSFSVDIALDFGDTPPPARSPMPDVTLESLGGLAVGLQSVPQDGRATIEHVPPGSYRIVPTPGLPQGYYPAAVMLGARDVTGQDLALAAGGPPIRIVYRPHPGTIRGTVENGAGATVLLWPEAAGIPHLVPYVLADARGVFELSNVPPGHYSVVAFDRVPAEGGAEPFVLGAVAAGTRVEVQEGGSASINCPVTRWPD
jgi:hypothetical protein